MKDWQDKDEKDGMKIRMGGWKADSKRIQGWDEDEDGRMKDWQDEDEIMTNKTLKVL